MARRRRDARREHVDERWTSPDCRSPPEPPPSAPSTAETIEPNRPPPPPRAARLGRAPRHVPASASHGRGRRAPSRSPPAEAGRSARDRAPETREICAAICAVTPGPPKICPSAPEPASTAAPVCEGRRRSRRASPLAISPITPPSAPGFCAARCSPCDKRRDDRLHRRLRLFRRQAELAGEILQPLAALRALDDVVECHACLRPGAGLLCFVAAGETADQPIGHRDRRRARRSPRRG